MGVKAIHEPYEKGQGVLRLAPTWVPRAFNQAGRRLRLHPDDYYVLGTQRNSIKERWFSSVVPAINGPLAPWDEGMSYVSPSEAPSDKILFKDAVEELGAGLIGTELMEKYGTWPMYSKFFDYKMPLFHHLHLDNAAAGRIGKLGKPEAYYFPSQLNTHMGEFPLTYFGFEPGVTKEMVRERLLDYERDDTRLTELSRAYRITLGTGWYTPAGVVHAPGSVLSYERVSPWPAGLRSPCETSRPPRTCRRRRRSATSTTATCCSTFSRTTTSMRWCVSRSRRAPAACRTTPRMPICWPAGSTFRSACTPRRPGASSACSRARCRSR